MEKRKGIIFLDEKNRLLLDLILVVLSIILLVLMIIRINRINYYFLNSQIAKGKVAKIVYFKDRGYFYYEYKVLGTMYKGKVFIHKTKDTTRYSVNDEISILVNPGKANKSIVKDFYS